MCLVIFSHVCTYTIVYKMKSTIFNHVCMWPPTTKAHCYCRGVRVLRVGLLAGEYRSMRLTSSGGALLTSAANVRLLQLVASIAMLLFTTSTLVRAAGLVHGGTAMCTASALCVETNAMPTINYTIKHTVHAHCQVHKQSQSTHPTQTTEPTQTTHPTQTTPITCCTGAHSGAHPLARSPLVCHHHTHHRCACCPRVRLLPQCNHVNTVGFGDVVVRSTLGRMVVLALILVGVVLIPVQAGQLYSQLAARRVLLGRLENATYYV